MQCAPKVQIWSCTKDHVLGMFMTSLALPFLLMLCFMCLEFFSLNSISQSDACVLVCVCVFFLSTYMTLAFAIPLPKFCVYPVTLDNTLSNLWILRVKDYWHLSSFSVKWFLISLNYYFFSTPLYFTTTNYCYFFGLIPLFIFP